MLNHHFLTANMASCLKPKRRLPTIKKDATQSMDAYLREIKVITDSLAAINSPLNDQELIQYTLFGLDQDYESFITAATYFGGHLTFHDLCSKLILYEQHVLYLRDHVSTLPTHQPLAMGTASAYLNNSTRQSNAWRGQGQPNRGGHNSN